MSNKLKITSLTANKITYNKSTHLRRKSNTAELRLSRQYTELTLTGLFFYNIGK